MVLLKIACETVKPRSSSARVSTEFQRVRKKKKKKKRPSIDTERGELSICSEQDRI